MVSFWRAVVDRLTPDVNGDESKGSLREMRRGHAALARMLWDLRGDGELPLARVLGERSGVDCGGVTSVPDAMLACARASPGFLQNDRPHCWPLPH